MKPVLHALLAVCLLVTVGCTSEEKDPALVDLETKIFKGESEIAGLEAKIKDAGQDHGLRNQLGEDKELLRSRLERLKDRYRALGGKIEAAPASGGGGGH